MRLIDVALNNLRRQKGKVTFLVLGLAIAVCTVVTLTSVAGRMNAVVANSLDEFGANILVLPASDDLALSYGGMSVSGISFDLRTLRMQDAALVSAIKNKDNISIVAPKLISAAEVSGKRALVVGVDFPQENRLKKWWSITGSLPVKPTEALVGAEARSMLGLNLNQRFAIREGQFVVTGILESTGSQDDGIVFIDLHRAQNLFGKPDQITLIEVAARCYDCPIDELVRQISGALTSAKVLAIRQAVESKMEAMHRFEGFSMGISAIVLVIAVLIVFTSMTASVNQRTREIGIFRAIGFRQTSVITIILSEALLVSAFAGLAGFLAGSGVSFLVSPMFGIKESVGLASPSLLGISLVLAIVVGLAGSVVPAIKASRLDPGVALKSL